MNKNIFFKKIKKISINEICKKLKINNIIKKNIYLNDIKTLDDANKNDLTFLHSSKYLRLIPKIKSNFIITASKFQAYLPNKNILLVNNVLLAVASITELFYPDSLNDNFKYIKSTNQKLLKSKKITIGSNVLIGRNVKIGNNTFIGHNSIIEDNVTIGKNCSIGSNVILKKTIVGNNVTILDGAVIGKKGFGFFPKKGKNLRYPHIGMVIIKDNAEIGSNNTIDRGSLGNTIIGENTFLDNQVHIAHNVKIGKNCIIAGQVGFAGSSEIGDNVLIGGQAGISGHLKIGNNVQIGGGSGVIKNIPDNTKVMGYPAKDIKLFLKENKK
jgi:UDP-3-O-[3-hydroxymyristoyl] glucosamine N-acyltransferase